MDKQRRDYAPEAEAMTGKTDISELSDAEVDALFDDIVAHIDAGEHQSYPTTEDEP